MRDQHSIEFWVQARESWRASGLTQQEYCYRNGLPLYTFKYKLKEIKARDKGQLEIVQVQANTVRQASTCEKSGIRLFAAGVGIELDEGFSKAALAAVLEVLHV